MYIPFHLIGFVFVKLSMGIEIGAFKMGKHKDTTLPLELAQRYHRSFNLR